MMCHGSAPGSMCCATVPRAAWIDTASFRPGNPTRTPAKEAAATSARPARSKEDAHSARAGCLWRLPLARALAPFSQHRPQMTANQTADSGLGGWARGSANGTRKTPCGFAVLGLGRAWTAAGHCALSLPRCARARCCSGRGREQGQLSPALRHGNANRPVVVVIPLAACLSHGSRPVASRPSRSMHAAYQVLYVFTIMGFCHDCAPARPGGRVGSSLRELLAFDWAGHATIYREHPVLPSTRCVELHGPVTPSHRDGLAWAEAAFQQGGGERVL